MGLLPVSTQKISVPGSWGKTVSDSTLYYVHKTFFETEDVLLYKFLLSWMSFSYQFLWGLNKLKYWLSFIIVNYDSVNELDGRSLIFPCSLLFYIYKRTRDSVTFILSSRLGQPDDNSTCTLLHVGRCSVLETFQPHVEKPLLQPMSTNKN